MKEVELTSAEIDRRLRRVAQLNRLCKSLKQAGTMQKAVDGVVGHQSVSSADAQRRQRRMSSRKFLYILIVTKIVVLGFSIALVLFLMKT
ncbi:hypothetical protein [Leptonema illini]|uniref:Uncharacterized protein n=1 Tax=Leptonema illini DSM 21528 TaxID=929563 RepID=H2CBU3_9LEPT|nr:hypothetical protein [Leptonema illini]EHQ08547.1 hypothetical protein Lepil_3895 [Leptonema illini DSM 21528]